MLKSSQLSFYRQRIHQLIKKVELLSSRCLFVDSLIHGTPAEVYRKCGRSNCKCAKNDKDRHGPYKAIQITRNGKQRQVSLRKDQTDLWEKAQHYQYQIKKLTELKKTCTELQDIVIEVIQKRIQEFPTDE